MITKAYENRGFDGARCRDRTSDIRLVRAVDSKDINNLGPSNRTKTGQFGVPRSTSVGTRKDRRSYARAYYRDTAQQRRKLRRDRLQRQRWIPRLIDAVLAELGRPLTAIVPRTLPVRRPLLKLPRSKP